MVQNFFQQEESLDTDTLSTVFINMIDNIEAIFENDEIAFDNKLDLSKAIEVGCN